MFDIGWRSIAVGLVFLLDLIVFADLVRGEFSDVRAKRVAIKRSQAPTVWDRGPTAPSPKGGPHMISKTQPASADPSATSTISPLGQLACLDDLEIAGSLSE
jgi:hypothetical protein